MCREIVDESLWEGRVLCICQRAGSWRRIGEYVCSGLVMRGPSQVGRVLCFIRKLAVVAGALDYMWDGGGLV